MFGPYQLNADGNVVKTKIEPNDTILYIVVGRYCRHDYIDNHYYKKELKKYLQHEPTTKAYFICPEMDTTAHSELAYFKVAINVSPGVKKYSVFTHTYEQLIEQLPTANTIRLYGHSYGGYFASRMLRELIKYYDRRIDTDGLKPTPARAFIKQTLQKLTIVTFGGARFHNYTHQIKHLTWYRPNIRHFVYTLDFIQMLHSKIYQRNDVVVLVPSLLDIQDPMEVLKIRLIFHNYEPFIQYIYRSGKEDFLNPYKPLSKMLKVHTGDTVNAEQYNPSDVYQAMPYDVLSISVIGKKTKLPSLPKVPRRGISISQQSPLPSEF